jgi:hypothetical protein
MARQPVRHGLQVYRDPQGWTFAEVPEMLLPGDRAG